MHRAKSILHENRGVPPGLAFLFSFSPGTSVPGFRMTPLRGWILEGFSPVPL